MARKPRHLSPEERVLWDKVVKQTTPMIPERPDSAAADTPGRPAEIPSRTIKPFRLGDRAQSRPPRDDLAPRIEDSLAGQPVQMDQKRFARMKRGKLSPEARIDLHGLTMAQAHPMLLRFVLNAVEADFRLVLVITGKGKSKPDHGPIPERHGVLRHQVPHWLQSPPLRAHVLQVSTAHVKHGGHGAYYVYLRRLR